MGKEEGGEEEEEEEEENKNKSRVFENTEIGSATSADVHTSEYAIQMDDGRTDD